jgi:hypothetical protein
VIHLPADLTAEGLLRRIEATTLSARILEEAGRAPMTLEERCCEIEELQRRLDRVLQGRSSGL